MTDGEMTLDGALAHLPPAHAARHELAVLRQRLWEMGRGMREDAAKIKQLEGLADLNYDRIKDLVALLAEAKVWLKAVSRTEEGAIYGFDVMKRIDAALRGKEGK